MKSKSERYIKIEGRKVMSILSHGPGENPEQYVEDSITLAAFLKQLTKETAPPISTSILPEGTKLYCKESNKEILVVEQKPRVATLQFSEEVMDLYSEEDPYEYDKPAGRRLSLALPYVIFIIPFVNKKFIRKWFMVFYRNQPITHRSDVLYQTNLFNMFYTDDNLCFACQDTSPNSEHPLNKQAEEIISNFWKSEFNTDSTELFEDAQSINKKISTLTEWKEATMKNPLFVLELKWKSTRRTIAQAVRAIFKGLSSDDENGEVKVEEYEKINTSEDLKDLMQRS